MRKFKTFSINRQGELITYERPVIAGIINVTPDSFYSGSRVAGRDAIVRRVSEMINDGADWIDIGAYSSRPSADDVSPQEELDRLAEGIKAVRKAAPDVILSVDTFRAEVARHAVTQLGADIINDISGGDLDPDMADTVACLNVPYILMHMRGTPATMSTLTDYNDVTADVLAEIAAKINRLALLGVNDVIVDPGFGFAKTVSQNYRLLHDLELFHVFERPLLVGMSRKSMIYKPLGVEPADALSGTVAANTIALMKGASILRVHDVKAAADTIKTVSLTLNPQSGL